MNLSTPLYRLCGLAFLSLPLGLWAQNTAPAVSNLQVVLDTVAHTATFNFDLSDNEADPLDVWLRISADNGRTWRIPANSLQGDAGYPITVGTGKSIVWHYDPNALSVALGPGNQSFTARVTADDRFPVDIADIVAEVDSARMMQTLDFIEGTRHRSANPVHHAEVRDSINLIRDGQGLQDWNSNFTTLGLQGYNLVSRKAGLYDDAPTWFVTAHYDSEINTPGADDNGSGTTGVIEAMRVLSQYEFRNSIRFIAFDLEEDGLLGSINYVQNRILPWEDVSGVLNMEMIGYYDDSPNSQDIPTGFNILFPDAYNAVIADSSRGNFLTNVANTNSEWLGLQFDTCAATYVPDLRVIPLVTPGTGLFTPDLRRSDHAPFWDTGNPALMLTDGANLRNPNYHQPGDSLSTIHPWFFHRSAQAVIATCAKLAQPLHAGSDTSQAFVLNLPVASADALLLQGLSIQPNPNIGRAVINADLPYAGKLRIEVRDAKGKRIALLHDQSVQAGKHSIEWNAEGLPSGTYYVWVSLDNARAILKDVILR